MVNVEASFKSLNLNGWIVKQCSNIGLQVPTSIQLNCIPEILKGKDCIGAAKTGSGKTLAFALPIIQKLCEDPYGIFALVLTPTRELAYQIADQFMIIGRHMHIKQCVIVGGVDMVEQGIQLSKHPHIVVATPGRLVDHLQSCKTFSLSRVKFLVMDEADRLLGGKFDQQIKIIFNSLPKDRQNLFFSATITDTLEKLKEVAGKEYYIYQAPFETSTVEQLEQNYILCSQDVRDAYLVQAIIEYRSKNLQGNILIFTNTCKYSEGLIKTENRKKILELAGHVENNLSIIEAVLNLVFKKFKL